MNSVGALSCIPNCNPTGRSGIVDVGAHSALFEIVAVVVTIGHTIDLRPSGDTLKAITFESPKTDDSVATVFVSEVEVESSETPCGLNTKFPFEVTL